MLTWLLLCHSSICPDWRPLLPAYCRLPLGAGSSSGASPSACWTDRPPGDTNYNFCISHILMKKTKTNPATSVLMPIRKEVKPAWPAGLQQLATVCSRWQSGSSSSSDLEGRDFRLRFLQEFRMFGKPARTEKPHGLIVASK